MTVERLLQVPKMRVLTLLTLALTMAVAIMGVNAQYGDIDPMAYGGDVDPMDGGYGDDVAGMY